MKRFSVALFFPLLLTACAMFIENPYAKLRDSNRTNLVKVERGMTRLQVIQIMGDATARRSAFGAWRVDDPNNDTFSNPYKRELIRDRQDREYEILYYYTEQIGNKHWEEGVTPVVLMGGQVVGVGWRYLEASDLNVTVRPR